MLPPFSDTAQQDIILDRRPEQRRATLIILSTDFLLRPYPPDRSTDQPPQDEQDGEVEPDDQVGALPGDVCVGSVVAIDYPFLVSPDSCIHFGTHLIWRRLDPACLVGSLFSITPLLLSATD